MRKGWIPILFILLFVSCIKPGKIEYGISHDFGSSRGFNTHNTEVYIEFEHYFDEEKAKKEECDERKNNGHKHR